MKRSFALVLLPLALACFLRRPGLYLPHDRGDAPIWAGVARNLSERGWEGYTVRGLEARSVSRGGGAAVESFACVAPPGALVQTYSDMGEKYWDAPLANQPPGFLLVLLASHALLGAEADGFPLVARDPVAFGMAKIAFLSEQRPFYESRLAQIERLPGAEQEGERKELETQMLRLQGTWERDLARRLARERPSWALRTQLWAMLPVLLSDLLTVVLVFAFAWRLGGKWAALLAGLAWATDPLALYCSERLLSNASLSLATAAALGLEEVTSGRKASWALSLLVGVACGLAISIKVSAVFLLPAIALGRLVKKEGRVELAVLLGAGLLLAAPWWLIQWRFLGHPFGFAWRNQADPSQSPWQQLVAGRGLLYYIETLLHSPLVLAGLVAAGLAWRKHVAAVAFAVFVIGAAEIFEHKEARHLLLAFPPLVVAASVGLVRLVERAKQPLAAPVAILLVSSLLVWQALHGIEAGLDTTAAP